MMKSQNHQVIRPIGKSLTDEEKKRMVIKELMDKRERFALNILHGLCTNMGVDATNAHAKAMVDLSVEMADALLEKLYPLNEEKAE